MRKIRLNTFSDDVPLLEPLIYQCIWGLWNYDLVYRVLWSNISVLYASFSAFFLISSLLLIFPTVTHILSSLLLIVLVSNYRTLL